MFEALVWVIVQPFVWVIRMVKKAVIVCPLCGQSMDTSFFGGVTTTVGGKPTAFVKCKCGTRITVVEGFIHPKISDWHPPEKSLSE